MVVEQCGGENVEENQQPIIDLSKARAEQRMHEMMDAVRPMANRFEKEMAKVINQKFTNGVQMFALILCDLLARVSVAGAKKLHGGDREAGIEFIESVYNGAKADALLEWEKDWS